MDKIKVKDAIFIDAIPQASVMTESVYVQIRMSQEYARFVIQDLQRQIDECINGNSIAVSMFGNKTEKVSSIVDSLIGHRVHEFVKKHGKATRLRCNYEALSWLQQSSRDNCFCPDDMRYAGLHIILDDNVTAGDFIVE